MELTLIPPFIYFRDGARVNGNAKLHRPSSKGDNMPYQKLTNVWLCSGVPLDTGHNHTIMFSTPTDQFAYFQGKTVHSATGCSYQRDSMCVAYPAVYDSIAGANYLLYRNDAYSTKYYYAFITNIEYINDSLSYVYFQLDAYQTYMFDITVGQGFVEREHVNDDTIGSHILEEPVAVGPYTSVGQQDIDLTDFWLVVGSTVNLKDTVNFPPASSYVYGGIYSGVSYFCFDASDDFTFTLLDEILEALDTQGKADAIIVMYMLPKSIAAPDQTNGGYLHAQQRAPQRVSYTPVSTLDGYNPRNNKLLSYPFRCLEVTNWCGNTATLRFEMFQHPENPIFQYVGGIQPASRAIIYPFRYEGVDHNYDYAISIGNYPQASWNSDVYANWLATATIRWGYQKERFMVNAVTGAIGSAIGAGSSVAPAAAALGPAGAGAVGVAAGSAALGSVIDSGIDYYNIQSSIAEEKEVHSIIPNTVQGTIGNDYTMVSLQKYGFHIIERTITAEYARTIDDFLSCFGYKVNRHKVPNMTGRASWNYVKCKTITIKGNVPYNYLQDIRSMFLNGCTFWHTTDVGNYSLSNSIVGG